MDMNFLFLFGRILLAAFFLMNGLNHFTRTKGMAGYAESKGVPSPVLAVQVSGLMLLAGGLSLLFGVYVMYGIGLLSLFLLSTAKVHAFWEIKDEQAKMMEMTQFMKNMAILGALWMLLSIPEPWFMSVGL